MTWRAPPPSGGSVPSLLALALAAVPRHHTCDDLGRCLAWVELRDQSDHVDVVVQLDENAPVGVLRLAKRPEALAIAPCGDRLALTLTDTSAPPRYSLHVYDLVASTTPTVARETHRVPLDRETPVEVLQWSTSGERVVVAGSGPADQVRIDTLDLQTLRSTVAVASRGRLLGLSPAGAACVLTQGGDLSAHRRDGRHIATLAYLPGVVRGVAWTNDDTLVIHVEDGVRSGLDVWRDQPGVATVRPLARHDAGERLIDAVTALCDHSVLVAWNQQGGTRLGAIDIDTGAEKEVAELTAVVRSMRAHRNVGEASAVVWLDQAHAPALPVLLRPDRPASHAAHGPLEPRRTQFRSPDGVECDAWLYECESPRGVVLAFHGGPRLQFRPGFSQTFAALRGAGATVLALNVRGSAGRRRAYEALDDGPRRLEVWQDVASALDFLRRGWPELPVATFGVSYGGLLAFHSLLRFPGLVAGAGMSGLYDLDAYMSDVGHDRAESLAEYGGDPQVWREFSTKGSSQLRAPFLMLHGITDLNVPVRLARGVSAWAGDGLARLVEIEEEGHGIHGAAARARANASLVAFYSMQFALRRRDPDGLA